MKLRSRHSCGPRRTRAARSRWARDMLYEMIPAYLEFFGFGTATPDELARSQV